MLRAFRNIHPVLGASFVFPVSEFLFRARWIWSGNGAAIMLPSYTNTMLVIFTTKTSLCANSLRPGPVFLPILTLEKGTLLLTEGISILSTFRERSSSKKSSSGGWSCTNSVACHKEEGKNNSKHVLTILLRKHISHLLFPNGWRIWSSPKKGEIPPPHKVVIVLYQ